ncbi:MAG: type IV toxin-antitoxin system AbiEi family antitoxin [Anaerolineales bacterium]
MAENAALEERAKKALLDCLKDAPVSLAEMVLEPTTSSGKRPDLMARLHTADGDQQVVVEVKANGQPKPAREAVNQILRYLETFPNAYGMLIAPFISTRAASICKQAGIGYVDFAGNCSIAFRNVYIRVDGQPNPFRRDRTLLSLFAPKASRVLRVLLNDRTDRAWKVKELSREASVSIGHVSNVKRLLEERELVRSREVGFSLIDPETLLMEWSDNYSYRENRIEDFYSLGSVDDIENELAQAAEKLEVEFALSGFSGASRLAPAVRYQRVMAYLSGRISQIAYHTSLKSVESGANVTILEPYDEGVFYGAERFDGVSVVSPVQIYLDVKGFRGRGEEAAEALLEQVIRPGW